jgi:hypothetical protein
MFARTVKLRRRQLPSRGVGKDRHRAMAEFARDPAGSERREIVCWSGKTASVGS